MRYFIPTGSDLVHRVMLLVLGSGALALGLVVESSPLHGETLAIKVPNRFVQFDPPPPPDFEEITLVPPSPSEPTVPAPLVASDDSGDPPAADGTGAQAPDGPNSRASKLLHTPPRPGRVTADHAGLLAELQSMSGTESLFGSGELGISTSASEFIGGVIGTQYGNQYGSGGLGTRGSGLGGGGTGEGLGGLGTRGRGFGASGYGSGGGYFGRRSSSSPCSCSYLNNPNKVHVPGHNTESYDYVCDNPFKGVIVNPLSTFSIDVDTASYSNVRRFLNEDQLPPKDAVRIEEMLNYFSYDYTPPTNDDPFSAHVEVVACPWAPENRLVRIGLKGWEMTERPPANLVFLLDVSGSMQPENKLPLVRRSMKMLIKQMNGHDRIAIVVYAGSSGLALPSTPGDDKGAILAAIDSLAAGGSTNGAQGIELAYKTATEGFIEGGINRVILATDGDFNVGVTNNGDLTRLIEDKAKSGVFLSVLGFGMGNYKDDRLETLADKGNGHYAYIDTLVEARRVLVDGMGGTLMTIAKDVKIQVEFNPVQVQGYRLIGYENRILAAEDFNDDTKDAGEIGAGHTVTALYEVVPNTEDVYFEAPSVDALRYQHRGKKVPAISGELMTLKLRYKQPDGEHSKKLQFRVKDHGASYEQASTDLKFAAAVAGFGMLLRDSPHKGATSFESVLELARQGLGEDRRGYRAEFVQLVRKARGLS